MVLVRLTPRALCRDAVGVAILVFAVASGSLVVLGASLLAASWLARASESHSNPMVALLALDETLSPDDTSILVMVQLGAATVAGIGLGLVGTSIEPPHGSAVEALAAGSIVVAARAMRTRLGPAIAAITATAALGPTCIGNPAVALGLAVASNVHGSFTYIGGALCAQFIGALTGAMVASLQSETTGIAGGV